MPNVQVTSQLYVPTSLTEVGATVRVTELAVDVGIVPKDLIEVVVVHPDVPQHLKL